MKAGVRWLLCLLLLGGSGIRAAAQSSPTQIQYAIIDLYALRNYPFTLPADSVVQEALARIDFTSLGEPQSQTTRIDLVTDSDFLNRQIHAIALRSPFLHKYLIAPYLPWLRHASPLDSASREIALPIARQDEEQHEALYAILGKQNVSSLLDQLLAPADPFNAAADYRYFFSGRKKEIDNQLFTEIAFYPQQIRPHTFTGYLYLSSDPEPALVRAVYTRSAPTPSEPIRHILWTQTFSLRGNKTLPLRNEARFALGDLTRGSLTVHRTLHLPADSIPPLSAADSDALDFLRNANHTRAFRNLETLARLALTDRLTLGGPDGLFDWGPVTQSISLNAMEGLRLRVGGNTTLALNPHFLAGGYLAYGTKDRQWKYRADLLYSFLPKDHDIWEFPYRLLSISYARDLNIPGQDLLNNRRDAVYNSFTYSASDNMSQQTLALLAYDHELARRLSFRIAGRYLSDEPRGHIRYEPFVTTEMQFSIRHADREIFLQNRDQRLYLRRAPVEWNLRHRIGLNRVLGSDHHYHITDFSARLRRPLPFRMGYADFRLSAGKVWNRLPFHLLFIPKGNQSYIYDEDDYNRMHPYEFITDRFVGLQADLRLRYSPLRLLTAAPIQTTLGIKALYAPLSDNNDPLQQPDLHPLPAGVHALNDRPYLEMHAGLANILGLFRIEWVQRMSYGAEGALLFGFAF